MKKNWTYKKMEEVGMKPDTEKELDRALNYQLGTINSIVVVKDEAIIYERYLNGAQKDQPTNVSTITISIMSALIGIAIDKGYIQVVEQNITNFFKEKKLSDAARSTTIKDLLTMSAAYSWKRNEPFDRMRRQKNWVDFLLGTLAKKKKERFSFSMGGTHLLSAILTKATGVSTREFANEHLFKPLGIQEVPDVKMKSFSKDDVNGEQIRGWVKDPQGINAGGWGLCLTAHDLAKLGCLYLNNGLCDGQQIISEKWIKASISQYFDDAGYSWWLRIEDDIEAYMAAATGGSYLYCIPKYNLVVAVISKMDNMFFDRWELVKDYILPSLNS